MQIFKSFVQRMRWLGWLLASPTSGLKKSARTWREIKVLLKVLRTPSLNRRPSGDSTRRSGWKRILKWLFTQRDPPSSSNSSRRGRFDVLYYIYMFLPLNKAWAPKNRAMSFAFTSLVVAFLSLFWFQDSSHLSLEKHLLKEEIARAPQSIVQRVKITDSLYNSKFVAPQQSAPAVTQTPSKKTAPLRPALQLPAEEKQSNVTKEIHTAEMAPAPEVWLRIDGGNVAELQHATGTDSYRIAISKLQSKIAFNVQLNISRLPVKANQRYLVEFRARADKSRSMNVGFARSHDAWYGLGLYNAIPLTPDWQEFVEEFWPTEDSSNGRIMFDMGENGISVEIAAISLIRLAE